jgi:hypothetical protein
VPEASRYRCCDAFEWVAVAEFGRVAGVDLALGRCGGCGMHLMTVTVPQGGSPSRVSLTAAEAGLFLRLRRDPAKLRAALESWIR